MLTLITPAAELPVSLDEAKLHLHVDFDDDDASIAAMIASAVMRLDGPDGYLGRCLRPQQWRLDLPNLRGIGAIVLPLPPCQSVDAVTITDETGTETAIDPTTYRVIGIGSTEKARVLPLASWPMNQSISITFTAGYIVTPEPIRSAILLRVGHLYENRESSVIGESAISLPLGEDDLIRNYRVWGF